MDLLVSKYAALGLPSILPDIRKFFLKLKSAVNNGRGLLKKKVA